MEMTDEHGQLNIDFVDKLTLAEVHEWLVASLTGTEVRVSGSGDGLNLPHYVFIQVCLGQDVRSDFRERLQLAILNGLCDLASDDDESIWLSVAGDRLLQLVEPLMRNPEYRSRAQLALVHMANSPGRYMSTSPNLHLRALQSLVAMGYRGGGDFWRSQLHPDLENRYASIVFAGLSLVSPDAALAWWVDAPSSKALESATPIILEEMVSTYGARHVLAASSRALETGATGSTKAYLESFIRSLEVAPKAAGPREVSERAQEFMERTGQDLNPDLPRYRRAAP